MEITQEQKAKLLRERITSYQHGAFFGEYELDKYKLSEFLIELLERVEALEAPKKETNPLVNNL